MARIIAYTYDADVHCPDCAKARFKPDAAPPASSFEEELLWDARRRGWIDAHGIPDTAQDSEGNPVRPVFSTDEFEAPHCGDCGTKLFN